MLIIYQGIRLIPPRKERGWPTIETDIITLAENANFHKELKKVVPVLFSPGESLNKKLALYRLAIDILVRFDPSCKYLRDQLRHIRYGDELEFESQLKDVIEKTIPEEYLRN